MLHNMNYAFACGMGPGHASDSTSTTVDTKMAFLWLQDVGMVAVVEIPSVCPFAMCLRHSSRAGRLAGASEEHFATSRCRTRPQRKVPESSSESSRENSLQLQCLKPCQIP